MRSRVMLMVSDVAASAKWYCQLLDATNDHGGADYDRVLAADGTLLLELHRFEADEHGITVEPDTRLGVGLLLYIEVPDVVERSERASAMGADVVTPPTFEALAHHTESVVRDPDGYLVALVSPGNVLD